jgi:hypothetical protein
MVAIVVFLFLSGRSIATSMVVVRPGTIGPAPLGAGTKWKAADDGFFASRCKAEGGGKKLAADVAGRRARRSRSSVRPCQSRTLMERPFQEIVGIRQTAAVLRRTGIGDAAPVALAAVFSS